MNDKPRRNGDDTQYSFFAFLSRMRQITRWSLMRRMPPC